MQNLERQNISISREFAENFAKDNWYLIAKRLIDIFASFVGLILLSPIMFIATMAIRIESKGPAIFTQERVGKDGKIFKMYKFRSMVIDAEKMLDKLKDKNEMNGPMFKIKEDPRITKVGKVLRKTSIDELPQLFNVLIGDMSLVGPRPNLPREVINFSEYHKQKLYIKPGITCYWQVMGRNNIDFDEWMELDIKYAKERNLWIDIKLIFRTIGVLFGDKNAS